MRDLYPLFIGFLLVLLVGCSTYTESAGEYLDSSATTTKVKASLIEHLGSSGFAIKVKTYKDEVQLSGFVDDLRSKQRAGVIASDLLGVKSVRNDIIIKSN